MLQNISNICLQTRMQILLQPWKSLRVLQQCGGVGSDRNNNDIDDDDWLPELM